jgi:hypothetical protein
MKIYYTNFYKLYEIIFISHAGSPLADFSTLKMEAIPSSETSVDARSTQRYIQEDDILHCHRCENLKFYIITNMTRIRKC